jgi:transglutaminase-like putative cysteine protease
VNSYLVYRASFYLMLTVATTALCADPNDDKGGWLLPPLVAAAGLFAFFTVDRKPTWALPRGLANVLAAGTLVLLYAEYKFDDTQFVRYLGHWLIALQLIKYFLPKSAEDDWFLFLVGLMQVLIGAVINVGDRVGAWLFLWAMLAVWVLGQFFLQREARRFLADGVPQRHAPLEPLRKDPYRGLFDWPYAAATVRVLALTLALGFFFFLLLPRQSGAARTRSGPAMPKHLTGFDEEVALGQLGEILENDSPVMTIEFYDADKNRTRPPAEPLWRGVTLNAYDKGRWRRQTSRSMKTFPAYYPNRQRGPVIRQAIKLEPNDSPTLFGIRPFVAVEASRGLPPSLNALDGTVIRPDSRGSYDYEVITDADSKAPQIGEDAPGPQHIRDLLGVDPQLKARLHEIATAIVKDVPEEGAEGAEARSQALESYLRSTGGFTYSLEMKSVDPALDPVLDFLINRKEGHCEYYASALALLLRSIEIPSRVVNGFKGGDFNPISDAMTVRQKHAHSWVEAYLGKNVSGRPIWITLDPTPSAEREKSIALVGGLASYFRTLTDLVRYIWVFYILGYDSNRQGKLLYTPIGALAQNIRYGSIVVWRWTVETFTKLFQFRSVQSFISVKGFVVSFLVLFLAAGVARLASWLLKKAIAWWRGGEKDGAGMTAGILFYRRLVQLLAEYELERSPAETQNEFANRAYRFLSGQGTRTQEVAGLPQKIVDAFYQVRFGHRDLSPEALGELESCLDALQDKLGDAVAK